MSYEIWSIPNSNRKISTHRQFLTYIYVTWQNHYKGSDHSIKVWNNSTDYLLIMLAEHIA